MTSPIFPSAWKHAIVLPLQKIKISSPKSLSDFRPISVLPALSKILEKIISCQILYHIENNKFLDPYQSGFRKGHICTTVLLKITEDIRREIDVGKCTILVLLDFKNAFGSVNYSRFFYVNMLPNLIFHPQLAN